MFRPVVAVLLLGWAVSAPGAERKVDPTFLHRYLPEVAEKPSDVSSPTAHYRPLFGAGDSETSIARGVARYGELTVDPGGASATVNYPAEEQIYFVLEGEGKVHYGSEEHAVRQNDFMYFPPEIAHNLANSSSRPCRVMVMGYKIPRGTQVTPPAKLLIANLDEVKKQVVGGHPPSTLYQLMMGDVHSTRDRLAAGHVLTSLFVMEFAPGGTNFPHHHDREEEIYFVLNGQGDMVAGGGMDGIEGRHPAKAGDAYFIRLNCTVGFYNREDPSVPKAHILAIRSRYPFPRHEE
ncbi:MAG TPA: cupin domain-containing protein [Bryobacteraceae bacterium]|nr:cupin domain-containing protein [Bryobacteraceae bacterium]